MTKHLTDLLQMMQKLRNPKQGCAWCRAQDMQSLSPYAIEEAHEVQAAINEGSPQHIKEELADLLFQVIFQSQIANEQGDFNFDDVCQALTEKLERRNPHVFADAKATSIAEVSEQWQRIKAEEKSATDKQGLLSDISSSLPATLRSHKIQAKAAEVNLDWPTANDVLQALEDETAELREAMQDNNKAHIESELGDVLFTCVNLARHLNLSVDNALNSTNNKFTRRFEFIERLLAKEGRPFKGISFDELLIYWDLAKKDESND